MALLLCREHEISASNSRSFSGVSGAPFSDKPIWRDVERCIWHSSDVGIPLYRDQRCTDSHLGYLGPAFWRQWRSVSFDGTLLCFFGGVSWAKHCCYKALFCVSTPMPVGAFWLSGVNPANWSSSECNSSQLLTQPNDIFGDGEVIPELSIFGINVNHLICGVDNFDPSPEKHGAKQAETGIDSCAPLEA